MLRRFLDALQVHERTLQGDFLIALLRDIISTRRALGQPLKVPLSSSYQMLACTDAV